MVSIREHTARDWGLDSPRDDWQQRAACRGMDPTMWDIADANDVAGQTANAAAVRICRGCPVQDNCWAQAEEFGSVGVIAAGRLRRGRGVVLPAMCRHCDTVFTPRVPWVRYCSERCRKAASRESERAKRERRKAAAWTI